MRPRWRAASLSQLRLPCWKSPLRVSSLVVKHWPR
jgi:hypothetical protein